MSESERPKTSRASFTLRGKDFALLEQIREYLKSEGHDGTPSSAVRYALFRVATSLPPPKREQEHQAAE